MQTANILIGLKNLGNGPYFSSQYTPLHLFFSSPLHSTVYISIHFNYIFNKTKQSDCKDEKWNFSYFNSVLLCDTWNFDHLDMFILWVIFLQGLI